MNELHQIADDLEDFLSHSAELVDEIDDAERKVNQAEESLGEEALSLRMCARISYGGNCGFAKSGRTAYVVNARNSRRVRATVRVRWRQGIGSGQYQRVYTLAAGGRRRLGCTRGSTVPVASYEYSVIGCEEL